MHATRLVSCTDHLWTNFAASAERTVQWGAKKKKEFGACSGSGQMPRRDILEHICLENHCDYVIFQGISIY